MKHFGDITKIKGSEVPLVDIVCGGSPCQDLSVAGQRKGLAGERSGLFMEQIRVIKEMRDECVRQLRMRGADYTRRDIRPRFMVWENVPGAFSSNKGEDFRAVLEETARIVDKNATIPRLEGGAKWTPAGAIMGDGWSIAWRVHDAQFWGVPQRRKRIALVADFAGKSAPEILFEREGVSRDIEKSREQGQRVATASKGDPFETISFQERAGCEGGAREYSFNTREQEPCRPSTISQSWDGSQTSPTLTANNAGGGQRMPDKDNFNAVITYGLDRASFNQGKNALYNFAVDEEMAQTLVSKGPGGGTSETVGALCARDYKGVGSQYVAEGKCIIQSPG